mgnify:CR=1 FL=1
MSEVRPSAVAAIRSMSASGLEYVNVGTPLSVFTDNVTLPSDLDECGQ